MNHGRVRSTEKVTSNFDVFSGDGEYCIHLCYLDVKLWRKVPVLINVSADLTLHRIANGQHAVLLIPVDEPVVCRVLKTTVATAVS